MSITVSKPQNYNIRGGGLTLVWHMHYVYCGYTISSLLANVPVIRVERYYGLRIPIGLALLFFILIYIICGDIPT